MPNSQRGIERRNARLECDEAFLQYVTRLPDDKPVIIGGDFNVAHKYIDIFPENLRNEENPSGFTEEGRCGLDSLIESGFADAYHHLYPNKEGAYTWWSS